MTGADILAAIANLKAAGGGSLRIPAGTYLMPSTIVLEPANPAVTGSAINIDITGDGNLSTVLDFSSCQAGSDGVAVLGLAGRFGLRGLTIRGAPRFGINLSGNPTPGPKNYVHRFIIDAVLVEQSGSHGFNFTNTYMGTVSSCESRNNQGRGFSLNGFHTSMKFSRCWAGGDAAYPNGGNVGSGWVINGATYCSLDACASDWNVMGYVISNVSGLSINACGCESNRKEGFYVSTSSSAQPILPGLCENINGLTLTSCFALNNSKDQVGGYANLLGASANDGRLLVVSTVGCVSRNFDAAHVATVYSSNQSQIIVSETNNSLNGGSTVRSGEVSVRVY